MKRLELTRLNARLQRDPTEAFPGDPCDSEGCKGVIHVYRTWKDGEGNVVRYLRCEECHAKPKNNAWME